jgi:hypothetical protein
VVEKPLPVRGVRHLLGTLVATLGVAAFVFAQVWIDNDPDATLSDWLPALVGFPLAFGLWAAAWALAAKIFQHRFEFLSHWGLAMRWLLGIFCAGELVRLLAVATGLPLLARAAGLGEAAAATMWVFLHARMVLPSYTRALAISFATLFVAGTGLVMVLNQQREQPLIGPLYMATLPYPSFRWPRPQTPEHYVDSLTKLRATLDARARDGGVESIEEELLNDDARLRD